MDPTNTSRLPPYPSGHPVQIRAWRATPWGRGGPGVGALSQCAEDKAVGTLISDGSVAEQGGPKARAGFLVSQENQLLPSRLGLAADLCPEHPSSPFSHRNSAQRGAVPTRGHRDRDPIGPPNRWASLPGLTVSARMLRYWSHSACRPLCVSSASLSLAARS